MAGVRLPIVMEATYRFFPVLLLSTFVLESYGLLLDNLNLRPVIGES